MTRDFSRQAFLGNDNAATFARVKVGVIGLGGGGSHIVQQLAHIGVMNYVLADPDITEDSNVNRLIGATASDVQAETPKVRIASRIILGINPTANVEMVQGTWQADQVKLRDCSVIVGCVDSYVDREQIERFCRRFLIPYIDIGMAVIEYPDGHHIVGQVAQSFPGALCLRCMNIVNDSTLKREVERYGTVGPHPQVVWPNGVLASTAVSLFVRLVTPWGPKEEAVYLEYNGNESRMGHSPRLKYVLKEKCTHYDRANLGDPLFALNCY